MRAAATVVYWGLVHCRRTRGCQNVMSLPPSTTTGTCWWPNPVLRPSEVGNDEVLLSPASFLPLAAGDSSETACSVRVFSYC